MPLGGVLENERGLGQGCAGGAGPVGILGICRGNSLR